MMTKFSFPPLLLLVSPALWSTSFVSKAAHQTAIQEKSPSSSLRKGSQQTQSHFVNYGPLHPLERHQYERNLQFQDDIDAYQNIRITFTDSLDLELSRNNRTTVARLDFLRSTILPRARDFWQQALLVYPIPDDTSICASSNSRCCGARAPNNTDLIVSVAFDQELYCAGSVSAVALTPCLRDQYGRPLAGMIRICPELLDIEDEQDLEVAVRILIHEMAHILGVNFEQFSHFYDFESGLPRTPDPEIVKEECVAYERSGVFTMPGNTTIREIDGGEDSGRYYEIVTPTVRAVARNQLNCPSLQGARWENNDWSCLGSHWDSRVFYTELMAGSGSVLERVISPLTLALLEDSGWYLANYSMSTVSPFGHGAGCDFLNERCLVDGEVSDSGQDFFCDKNSFAGCVSSHERWMFCDLQHWASDIPDIFQYYENATLGGRLDTLDYCPTYSRSRIQVKSPSSESDSFRLLESRVCTDTTNNDADGSFARVSAFEVYGPESRCFNSNIQVGSDVTVELCDDDYGCHEISDVNFQLPLCLKSRCNKDKHAVEIVFDEDTVHTCTSDGEQVELPDAPGSYIECPKLAQICPDLICPYNCAGRGVCDYAMANPKCICNDPNDSSPACFNSPRFSIIENEEETNSPPTQAPITVEETKNPPVPSPTQDPLTTPADSLSDSDSSNTETNTCWMSVVVSVIVMGMQQY